jgi:hypothetical protein
VKDPEHITTLLYSLSFEADQSAHFSQLFYEIHVSPLLSFFLNAWWRWWNEFVLKFSLKQPSPMILKLEYAISTWNPRNFQKYFKETELQFAKLSFYKKVEGFNFC